MNRNLARVGAMAAVAAGLGAAVIAPLAGSASAATLPRPAAVAAATTYRLAAQLPFRGYGYNGDLNACVNLAAPVQKVFPQDVIYCTVEYSPSTATASDHYDVWTAWLWEWIPA